VLDTAAPGRLAEFWKLSILRVSEPKVVKNRMHIDVRGSATVGPDDRWSAISDVVALLTGAGGSVSQRYEGHHVTMADPEGNEFDVC
jgi:hypothetical protein